MFVRFDAMPETMYDDDSMLMRDGRKRRIRLARAYVPRQPFTGMFPLNEALKKGTLFPNLYIPYSTKSRE